MELFEAQDSKTFLSAALKRIQTKSPKFGYAALVRKAGLVSRSFPREVVLGKKFLSQASARKLSSALSLSLDLKSLFLLLVKKDELDRKNKTPEALSHRIRKTRNRIRLKSNPELQIAKNLFYKRKGWIEVWASLSSIDQNPDGVAIETVSSRSGLAIGKCRKILSDLELRAFVQRNSATAGYSTIQSEHLILEELGGDTLFQSWFINSLEVAKKTAEMSFKSDDHLFMNSVVLVQKKDLPKLKQELREVITRFMDLTEDQSGEHLARLSVALF